MPDKDAILSAANKDISCFVVNVDVFTSYFRQSPEVISFEGHGLKYTTIGFNGKRGLSAFFVMSPPRPIMFEGRV